MSNYLITGASSGIGRELVKQLIFGGNRVLGIARRKELLSSLRKELGSKKFKFIDIDISKNSSWKIIVKHIKETKFYPKAIVFNAAIFEKDYQKKALDITLTRQIFETNFFSVIKGFEEIIKISKKNTQFIFISSSSALKGSGAEGVGYPSSKAALSIAFESLYQKYKGKFKLKIIYLGPVNTDMHPLTSRFTPIQSKEKVAEKIIKAINSQKTIHYFPWYLFVFLRTLKILPEYIYLTFLRLIDILHLEKDNK